MFTNIFFAHRLKNYSLTCWTLSLYILKWIFRNLKFYEDLLNNQIELRSIVRFFSFWNNWIYIWSQWLPSNQWPYTILPYLYNDPLYYVVLLYIYFIFSLNCYRRYSIYSKLYSKRTWLTKRKFAENGLYFQSHEISCHQNSNPLFKINVYNSTFC